MKHSVSQEGKQKALVTLLDRLNIVRLPAQIVSYTAALGAIALVGGANIPPDLAFVFGSVGANILSNILDRVARGETLSDEEIRSQVTEAVEQSGIREHFSTFQQWFQAIRADNEEFRNAVLHYMEGLATREQAEEILSWTSDPDIHSLSTTQCRGFVYHTLRVPIERTQLIEALFEFALTGNGIVVGAPGSGKSYVLGKLSERIHSAGHACVCIPVAGIQSRTDLSTRLGIHSDVVKYLKEQQTTLNRKPGLILIDGFDAARSTVTRNFFLSLISEFIRELHPNWNIVVSVRTYDAMKSETLLELFPTTQPEASAFQLPNIPCRHFGVPPLDDTEVQVVLNAIPGAKSLYEQGTHHLRELLRNPFNLWLVEKMLSRVPFLPELSSISSETELLSLFWRQRINDHELSHELEQVLTVVSRIMVDTLDRQNLVVSKEPIVSGGQSSEALDELLSLEILVYSSGLQRSLEFSHNILFDFAVARLVLPDNADRFIDYFGADNFKTIFLFPSLEYYFTYLWLHDIALFWKVFWRMYSPNIPVHLKLLGRLALPRVIVVQAQDSDQLTPLLENVRHGHPSGCIAMAATLRIALTYPALDIRVWSDFAARIAHCVPPEFANELIRLTDRLIDLAVENRDSESLKYCGEVSRALAEWVLHERDSVRKEWIDSLGARGVIPLIAKSFVTEPSAAEAFINSVVQGVAAGNLPLEYLHRLVEHFPYFVENAPELISSIYETVFSSTTLGDGSGFGGGIVVRIFMSNNEHRKSLDYLLVGYFSQFLAAHPIMALTTGIRCVNHLIIREHVTPYLSEGVQIGNVSKPFNFRGKTVTLVRDASHTWIRQTFDEHEPLYMATQIFLQIEQYALEQRLDEAILNSLLDIFRDNAQAAFLWGRLLELGARYPDLFAVPLFDLCVSDAFLLSNEVMVQLGMFLETTPRYYRPEQMVVLENVILSLPKNEIAPDRRELLEWRRNRLLARIPDEIITTDEAKSIRRALETHDALPENDPLFSFSTFSQRLTTEELFQERGVDLKSPENQFLQSMYLPVRAFNEHWQDKHPEQDALLEIYPRARALYEALLGDDTAADELVIKLSWTELAECVAQMCLGAATLGELRAFCKEVMLLCAQHPLPEPNPAYDTNHKTLPSSTPPLRTAAAKGLLKLASYKRDAALLDAIEKLLNDPDPSVRSLVAHRLFLVYSHAPEFFWQAIDERLAKEENIVVLKSVYSVLSRPGIRETQEAQTAFAAIVEELLDTNPNSELLEHIMGVLSWYMFVAKSEWVLEIGTKILNQPIKYIRPLRHLVEHISRFIVPNNVFSEEKVYIAKEAIAFAIQALGMCKNEVVALRENTQLERSEELRDQLQQLQQIVNTLVNGIYFNIGVPRLQGISKDELQLTEVERQQFYFFVKELLMAISQWAIDDTLGILAAYTAHHFCELMNEVLKYDPVDVLQMTTNIVRSSQTSGYHFDAFAVKEVVKLADSLLADHQEKLRDNVVLENLLTLIDIFAEAGWPEALELLGRLPEVAR